MWEKLLLAATLTFTLSIFAEMSLSNTTTATHDMTMNRQNHLVFFLTQRHN